MVMTQALIAQAAREVTQPPVRQFPSQIINIAISTSALFDTRESQAIFKGQGEAAFRSHMQEKARTPFGLGPAFPFVAKMLGLNRSDEPLVNLTILSRSNPQVLERVHHSLTAHGLVFPDKRRVRQTVGEAYTSGQPITPQILDNFQVDIFLSRHEGDVKAALAGGFAAGLVMGEASRPETERNKDIVLAFDFDRVVAVAKGHPRSGFKGDSEEFFQVRNQKNPDKALIEYLEYETPHNDLAAQPGPLKAFFVKLFELRKHLEQSRAADDTQLKIAVVTARSGGVLPRVITTLRNWGVEPDELYSVGTSSKTPHLRSLRADVFFDDSERHAQGARQATTAIWVPWAAQNDLTPNPSAKGSGLRLVRPSGRRGHLHTVPKS